jgi:hypothetical protein
MTPSCERLGHPLTSKEDFRAILKLCGGSSRSEVVREILQNELFLECNIWDPASFVEKELSPQPEGELDRVRARLSVAVGAALSAM